MTLNRYNPRRYNPLKFVPLTPTLKSELDPGSRRQHSDGAEKGGRFDPPNTHEDSVTTLDRCLPSSLCIFRAGSRSGSF